MINNSIMKSKVQLNLYCKIATLVVIAILVIGVVSSWGIDDKFILLLVILAGSIAAGLFYFPTYIEADETSLVIHRVLRSKVIPYDEISSVDRCIPSAAGIRLCGSGGFMGYWGYFNDIIIGSYFGYYGNRDQCILVRLKDGRQYVISCLDPDKMIEFITKRL